MKNSNILFYDAFLHIPELRQFSEKEQYEIIEEAVARAGSMFPKHASLIIGLGLFGLSIAVAFS